MALTWDIVDCKLDKEWQKSNWNAIEQLIFTTMVIDVGKITNENLEMVEFRIRLYSILSGHDYSDVIAILPKMVGLKTNVHTTTEKEYDKRIVQMMHYEAKRQMQVARYQPKQN